LASFGIGPAAAAMGGRLASGDPAARAAGAAIDSRRIRGGEIFFAFAGAQVDGHDYVADAFARGAAAAVVSRPVASPAAGAVIEVADVLEALHALARHCRDRGVPAKLVGITGSAGKTTTKELLGSLLASRFRTARTPGNLNNLYGFPLSLLNVPDDTEWMVAEMGMSTPGELRQLSLLGRPDAAVFTVVRPVHLEFFGTVRAIAEAKAELLAGVPAGGLVVANADDPEVSRIALRFADSGGGRVVPYGLGTSADVRARHLRPAPDGEIGSRFTLMAGGEEHDIRLPLHGLYNAENFLAAAAAAWALGVPLTAIAEAAREARPAAMRGVVHRAEAGFTLIDDSYNSNPDAAAKALAGAVPLPAARRIAVLGDMLELGPESPRFHEETGREAARRGFSPVAGVGEASRRLVDGARDEGAEAHWFADARGAADWAAAEVREGDLVLVKGSRGIGLEAVVSRLLAQPRLAAEVGG
jgi:UDP-N-acetylmuramoyl-tripeptide--D-alanyl-D-alanine ligase